MLLTSLTSWSAHLLKLFQHPGPWTAWHPDTGHPTCMAMQWGHDGSSSHEMHDLICHVKGWDAITPWEGEPGLGGPRGQVESRPLETLILDPFWSNLWCLTSWEKLCRYKVLASITCKPPPDLPGGQCAAASETSLWSKEKLLKHALLFFMPKSVCVPFRVKIKNPEILWVIVKMPQKLTLMHRDLVLHKYW